ncbi:MAG: hypothetical protein M1816_003876 [Peltula sp. TS41687]|nr:MAG: hypothetical protein M1816_003876 [Peltula sp. TS41687]
MDTPAISVELQQRLLDLFKASFRTRFSSNLSGLLQEIKGHLYERNFQKAFENDEYLEAYAVRWSASRALAYLAIFHDLRRDHIIMQQETTTAAGAGDGDGDRLMMAAESCSSTMAAAAKELGSTSASNADRSARMNVTCLGGGGGAEAVALGGLMHASCSDATEALSISLDIFDIADWSGVLRRLERSIFAGPPQSAQGPAAGMAIHQIPLITRPDQFDITFHQRDVLDLDESVYEAIMRRSDLVTLMFTLNELYAASMARTTDFLLAVTSHVKKGTLLLVVDSPGSYSTVVLGSDDAVAAKKKKYPMQWLLDHTLLTLANSGHDPDQVAWEKLVSDDSRWFRLPDKLQYPIRLENTRYQLHLYRRV